MTARSFCSVTAKQRGNTKILTWDEQESMQHHIAATDKAIDREE